MRVRIKKHPLRDHVWEVEVKYWWSSWILKEAYWGDESQARALAAAKELINPTITEVFK